MAKSKQGDGQSPESHPQKQSQPHSTQIRNLIETQSYYDYKDTQRGHEGIWPPNFKKALIDSILRGLPIPPFLIRPVMNEEGEEVRWVVDGQQRLTTIFEFRAGMFATATEATNSKFEPNSLPPIEPGCRWSQLSLTAQFTFNNYILFFYTLDDTVSEEVEGLIFRRLQHQVPLKPAEKLASYLSKTRSFALDLQKQHPIWSIYQGDTKRKQLFQAALCVIVLELTEGFSSLSFARLKEYASGLRDEQMTPQLSDIIEGRLEVVAHVFKETKITHWAEMIPLYQSVLFLEQRGHKFTSSDERCLTPWYAHIQEEANAQRAQGYNTNPLVQLLNRNVQREFWEDHLPGLVEQCKEKVTSAA